MKWRLLLLLISVVIAQASADAFPYAEHPRYKRQGLPATQIDLNITVPFIFSARLYQFGAEHGDAQMQSPAQHLQLQTPMTYFRQQHKDIWILRDGVLGFDGEVEAMNRKQAFPRGKKSIAVFWVPASLGESGRVWYRESRDLNTLRLASSEIALQYGLPEKELTVDSVLIVTWENLAPKGAEPNLGLDERNTFQISIIISSAGTFAHVVYSKLRWNDLAVAGFNEGEGGRSFSLPGSGLPQARLLANQSDIGIPGEWIFRIDEAETFLCGPGYKGLECIAKCVPGEWHYDCSRRCHCDAEAACCRGDAAGDEEGCACACHPRTGRCTSAACKKGWRNFPTCDEDVDECSDGGEAELCPSAQPDCVNTPGAYLCMCLKGYDNATNACIGSENLGPRPTAAIVPVQTETPRVNTPRVIVPVLLGKLPIRRTTSASLASSTTGTSTVAATTAPPLRTIVPVRGGRVTTSRRPRPRPPPRARPRNPIAGLPPGLTSSAREIVPSLTVVQRRTTQAPVIAPSLDPAGSFGFGSDYDYDYEEETKEAERRAEVEMLPPQTSSSSSSTPRPHRPITPRIIQPVTLGSGRGRTTTRRLGIRPITRVAPPTPTTARRGGLNGGGVSNGANVQGGFLEERSPFEERQCSLSCGPNAECASTHGGEERCLCRQGFRQSAEGDRCEDVDECVENNGLAPCGPNAACENEAGGFSCVCAEGFVSNGTACVDVDECASGEANVCEGGAAAECVNLPGSFECRCRPGYNGSPSSILGCIDINECLIPDFYCGPSADCENTDGGFRCHCLPGFHRPREDGVCEDVDECLRAPCHAAATCINQDGGFQCRCLNGYSGDGFSCSETILFPFDLNSERKLPPTPDSVVEVMLSRPLRVLGVVYDKVYISAHGVVSFNAPLRRYEDAPLTSLGLVGFAPLYQRGDLPTRGSVVFQETSEFSRLTRASLNVEEDFRVGNFRAESVFIVTFADVAPPGSQPSQAGNTYQLVLVNGGDAGVYATLIFDSLQPVEGAESGVLGGEEVKSLPVSALKTASNVGQPGKWMMRVDSPRGIAACPAGLRGPPMCGESCEAGRWGLGCVETCRCGEGLPCDFASGVCANAKCQPGFKGPDCQTDVDECLEGLSECDANADCANALGTYSCQCRVGFFGDGFTCQRQNECAVRYGVECSDSAECRLDIAGAAVCVCLPGYDGDGFSCTQSQAPPAIGPLPPRVETSPDESVPRSSPRPLFTPEPTQPPEITAPPTRRNPSTTPEQQQLTTAERRVTEPPVSTPRRVFPALVTPARTAPPPFQVDNSVVEVEEITTRRPRPVRVEEERPRTPRPTSVDNLNNLLVSGNAYDDNSSNLLVIIIPAVLCGVWLILIVILLVVCLRRRKQRQRDKFGLGYYLPPPSTQKGAAPAPSSAYSGYSSQWTIPRPPQSTNYDYSQYSASSYAGYPSADPYAHYKY